MGTTTAAQMETHHQFANAQVQDFVSNLTMNTQEESVISQRFAAQLLIISLKTTRSLELAGVTLPLRGVSITLRLSNQSTHPISQPTISK